MKNKKQESSETPQIYNVEKDLSGWKFSRRDFLAAATAAAAIGTIGAKTNSEHESSELEGMSGDTMPVTITFPIIKTAASGEFFSQTWQFTNHSATERCQEMRLHFEGEGLVSPSTTILVPDIAPGETVAVKVDMIAPVKVGTYHGEWHLQAAHNSIAPGASGPFIVLSGPVSPPVESAHPYANNTNQTWTITNPDVNAEHTRIHFAQIDLENGYDFLYIRDGSGQLVQSISADYPGGLWSSPVPGRDIQVQLVTDGIITAWGFSVDQVETCHVAYLPIIRKQPTPTPTPCPCHTYCSCDSVCTCNTVHYWYPN